MLVIAVVATLFLVALMVLLETVVFILMTVLMMAQLMPLMV